MPEKEDQDLEMDDVITTRESGHERYETEALSKGGESDE